MRVVSAIQPHLVPFSSRVRAFPRGRASRASETRARWDARVPDSDRQQNAPRLPPSARDARARDPSFSLSFSLTAIPTPSPSAARHLRGLPALEQITSRVQVLEWGIWALQGERQHANPCMHAYMHTCIHACCIGRGYDLVRLVLQGARCEQEQDAERGGEGKRTGGGGRWFA